MTESFICDKCAERLRRVIAPTVQMIPLDIADHEGPLGMRCIEEQKRLPGLILHSPDAPVSCNLNDHPAVTNADCEALYRAMLTKGQRTKLEQEERRKASWLAFLKSLPRQPRKKG